MHVVQHSMYGVLRSRPLRSRPLRLIYQLAFISTFDLALLIRCSQMATLFVLLKHACAGSCVHNSYQVFILTCTIPSSVEMRQADCYSIGFAKRGSSFPICYFVTCLPLRDCPSCSKHMSLEQQLLIRGYLAAAGNGDTMATYCFYQYNFQFCAGLSTMNIAAILDELPTTRLSCSSAQDFMHRKPAAPCYPNHCFSVPFCALSVFWFTFTPNLLQCLIYTRD